MRPLDNVRHAINSFFIWQQFPLGTVSFRQQPLAAALTCRISFLFYAVIFGPAHLNLDKRADDSTSMLWQVPGAQHLQTRNSDHLSPHINLCVFFFFFKEVSP